MGWFILGSLALLPGTHCLLLPWKLPRCVSHLSRHTLLPSLTARNATEEGELTWWLQRGADSEIPLTCPPTDAELTRRRRVGAGGRSVTPSVLAGRKKLLRHTHTHTQHSSAGMCVCVTDRGSLSPRVCGWKKMLGPSPGGILCLSYSRPLIWKWNT